MDVKSETRKIALAKCPTCGQALSHPAWGFLKFALACCLLTFLLYQNASNFDETELKVLFWFGVVVSSFKWGLGPQIVAVLERWTGVRP